MNVSLIPPIWISSPSLIGAGPSARLPFTSTPFLLPRSWTVKPFQVRLMSAWRREMFWSLSAKSHSGLRPKVISA